MTNDQLRRAASAIVAANRVCGGPKISPSIAIRMLAHSVRLAKSIKDHGRRTHE